MTRKTLYCQTRTDFLPYLSKPLRDYLGRTLTLDYDRDWGEPEDYYYD